MEELILKIGQYANIILNDDNIYQGKYNDVFDVIDELFRKWEIKIENEHKKSFVTDDLENKFVRFATACVSEIINYFGTKILNQEYEKHLEQMFQYRHIGYGFYIKYEEVQTKLDKNDIEIYNLLLKDNNFCKKAYLSLAMFYKNFFGKFHNNEAAIRQLCKYYPCKIKLGLETFSSEEVETITAALFMHISNAGTAGDMGYAYNGIEYLKNGVNYLSKDIVEKILQTYPTYQVRNNKVSRRQIYTLIAYFNFSDEEKYNYKFFYLDSIWLAHVFGRMIYKHYNDKSGDISPLPWRFNLIVDSQLPLFETKDGDMCYWTFDGLQSRNLMFYASIIAGIQMEDKVILLKFNDKEKIVEFDFNDWNLNNYNTQFEEELLRAFWQDNLINNKRSQFLFSHVLLKEYRGMDNQQISFDHKFSVTSEGNKINIIKEDKSIGMDNFYGERIYSLSCIVGRNGSGKTSIVDFLRNFFFAIINLIEEKELPYNNEVVHITNNLISENKIFKKDVAFLVIFSFNEQYFYLTNMNNVQSYDKQIKPYPLGLIPKKNEHSKLFYFSSLVDSNDPQIFDSESRINSIKGVEGDLAKYIKSDKEFLNADYSENYSFMMKQRKYMQLAEKQHILNAITSNEEKNKIIERGLNLNEMNNLDSYFNRDLIYQVVFLNDISQKELNKLFDYKVYKENISCNYIDEENEENKEDKEWFQKCIQGKLKEVFNDNSKKELRDNIFGSESSKLEFFSSGQYAKFAFLSKLYWCLHGYDEYQVFFEKVFHSNIFNSQHTIQKFDTAIIFIDEGELCYHPEWQRTYINTLITMLRFCKIKVKLQIVISTNSPFIISDIRGNDITYLTENSEKSHLLTFGQNIHTLLLDNLFMEATIGEFAEKRIGFLIRLLNKQKDSNYFSYSEIKKLVKRVWGVEIPEEYIYDYIGNMIKLVGEDVYRIKLLTMLERCIPNEESEIQRLEQQKAEIEEQIRQVKGEKKA